MTDIVWTQLDGEQKGNLIRPLIVDQLLTYAQIGRMLGVSRVAIAGAAHRNKIISPLTKGNSGAIGSRGATANKARGMYRNDRTKATDKTPKQTKSKVRPIPAAPILPDFTDKTPLRPELWLPLPDTQPQAVEHHQLGTCRWPIGENPTKFCCAPADKGSWCAAHHKIAFRPTPPMRLKKRKSS